ncbi:hypothetical protein AGR9A_Cc80122 [Agrobacterium salinitolerans str. Hayward 0363]|nr:hypothetical protein AGR9A_Cc80122 [Agrobacterium salinitolerans str. Hayward 0363]
MGRMNRPKSGRAADADTLFLEVALQFAGLEHLSYDVTAADEFALDVELRDGWPIGIVLDALTDVAVGKHVDALVLDAEIIEDLYHLAGKTALRKLRGALHEKNDVVALHFAVDHVVNAAHRPIPFTCGSRPLLSVSL